MCQIKRDSDSSAADAVDEQLARYRSMRDFSVTEEPSGGSNKDSAKAASLLRSETCRVASSLRLSVGMEWCPEKLGGRQRAQLRHQR